MSGEKRRIVLAAGGTGGHLFPAEALANVLIARGFEVHLVSDDRAARYADTFPARLHQVKSGTVTGSGLIAKAKGMMQVLAGTRQCLGLMTMLRPAAVVGFGGYPTLPPLYAATIRGIPSVIHEANAVMGRANRFLAPRVTKIATGFPLKQQDFPGKTVVTGNPVRPPVLDAAKAAFQPIGSHGALNLLVFGGSQGARIMSQIVPPAISLISEERRGRLRIVQQAREEDIAGVREIYANLGVETEIAPFFKDLPARIAASHLVISRSGASTCAELAVIGRPSILVPLPGSIDQDQAANAAILKEAGAATVQPQPDFTPDWLAGEITRALDMPESLATAAAAARAVATPDAAERLADLVITAARL